MANENKGTFLRRNTFTDFFKFSNPNETSTSSNSTSDLMNHNKLSYNVDLNKTKEVGLFKASSFTNLCNMVPSFRKNSGISFSIGDEISDKLDSSSTPLAASDDSLNTPGKPIHLNIPKKPLMETIIGSPNVDSPLSSLSLQDNKADLFKAPHLKKKIEKPPTFLDRFVKSEKVLINNKEMNWFAPSSQ